MNWQYAHEAVYLLTSGASISTSDGGNLGKSGRELGEEAHDNMLRKESAYRHRKWTTLVLPFVGKWY